jgi:hypothetical protein
VLFTHITIFVSNDIFSPPNEIILTTSILLHLLSHKTPTKQQRNKYTWHNNIKINHNYNNSYIHPNNSNNNITTSNIRPINIAAARLLGLRVRIQPGAYLSLCCECCVLVERGQCVGPISLQGSLIEYMFFRVTRWNNDSVHLKLISRTRSE